MSVATRLRSASSAALILRTAGSRGVPAVRCLAGTGLTVRIMNDPDGRLTSAQELRLIENVLDEIDDPALGVYVGQQHTLGSFGILGLGALTSPTVRSALKLTGTYAQLTYVFTDANVERRDGRITACLPHPDLSPRTVHFLADLWAATLAAVIGALAPGMPPYSAVTLPRPRPEATQPWESALGVLPEFGAAHSMAVLDPDTLDHRLTTSDAQARVYCEQHCAELLAERGHGEGVAAMVRVRMLLSPGRLPDQAQVARELGLSQRTLQRRLGEEGVSFRQVRDEVRHRLARRMLAQPELSLTQIASALDYDHPGSFTRAYQRWTGARPSDARSGRG